MLKNISIHAPAKGATSGKNYSARIWKFQSTLPRRERQVRSQQYSTEKTISIHAPAKGATSLHSPRSPLYAEFQSTLPRRERHVTGFPRLFAIDISIHAPAKGATRELEEYLPTICNFNPRSREGSDTHVPFS